MNKRVLTFVIVFGILIFGILINTFIHSRNEILNNYYFVITKIEVSPTNTLVFYNKEKEVQLWNYTIMDDENVLVGDIIFKDKCSKYLHVLRKDKKSNKYKEFLKVQPSGILKIEWICN